VDDLAKYGYVEEEFFLEGTANRYTTPAGATGAIVAMVSFASASTRSRDHASQHSSSDILRDVNLVRVRRDQTQRILLF
jgi:hypothetical protein